MHFKFLKFLKKLGPGIITGASDDDPSGIATYSQAGAKFGFKFLWLSWFSFPLMYFVQEMCARIGMQTGRGLASNIRLHFSKRVLYFAVCLLFFANVINLGVDLGAMAKAIQLFLPGLNFYLLIFIFAILILFLEIKISYQIYSKYLKILVVTLFSYVFASFFINLNLSEVVKSTLIPSIDLTKDSFIIICGVLGTTISPYLFFWQASEENEEEIALGRNTIRSREGAKKTEIRIMRFDVFIGMFFSNLIMFFIILTTGATLFRNGIFEIVTAEQAALALKPLAGDLAYMLFAGGIISTGMLSIPVLAGSASYAVSEMFNKREGLSLKFCQAPFFYSVMIIAVLIGVVINFLGINPIQALVYTAVLNGILASPLLILVVLISANRKVMNENVNSLFVTLIGIATACLMMVSGVFAIASLF